MCAGVLTVALTACTPSSFRTHPTTHASALAVKVSTSTPTATSTPASTPSPVPQAQSPAAGQTSNHGFPTPVDHGPEQYATGEPIADSSGRLVAYRVASGDILDFVAERFGLPRYSNYILTINQVRRGYTGTLYADDIVNLDPSTIYRYGSINGEVLHDPAPAGMPAQR
jgi:hypothetical protein